MRTTKLVGKHFVTTSSGWFAKMVESCAPKRAVVLFLFVGILLPATASEITRTRTVIFPKVSISPDDSLLAFCAGPEAPDTNWPEPTECKVYVLDLTNKSVPVMVIPGPKNLVTSMSWRPGTSPPELFVVSDGSEPNLTPICLLGVRISDIPSVIYSQDLTKNVFDKVVNKVLVLSWSPDGKVLAVGRLLTGLHISYDKGRTFISTGIPAMGTDNYVWVDNETLYVRDEDRILEVKLRNGQANVKRTVSSGKVRLCGSLDGKVVYRTENDIYCGDNVLYHSSEKIGYVFADDSFLAFQSPPPRQEGSHIFVLDKEGNVVSKKNMERDTNLVGLSSKRKFVYLLKGLQCFQKYSIDESDKISTIYQIAD